MVSIWPWETYTGVSEIHYSDTKRAVVGAAVHHDRAYVELQALVAETRPNDGSLCWKPGTQRFVVPVEQIEALCAALREAALVAEDVRRA